MLASECCYLGSGEMMLLFVLQVSKSLLKFTKHRRCIGKQYVCSTICELCSLASQCRV